jgi:murein DD-endopeptidase MepM/ murein hydrolase activator NlpD
MIVALAEGECPQYGSLDNSCADNLPSLASPIAGGSLSQRVITGSLFGDSWPRTYCNNLPKKHVGIDLRANFNEPVYAAYDGTVTRVRPSSSWCTNWGSTIIIDHSGLFTTIYEHVDPEQQITAGSKVKKAI